MSKMIVLLVFTMCISQGIDLAAGFDDLGDLDSGGNGFDLGSSSPGGASTSKKCLLLNITNAVPATKERTVGSIMIFTCIKGYKKIGGDDARECLSSGKWSGKDVVCKLITCPPAPNVTNGDKVVTNSSTAVLGSQVTYTCKKFHNPSGNNTRVCEKSGKWSKTSFKCIHIPCPIPRVIKHATFTMTAGMKVGSVLTYNCSKFFTPIGSGVSTCLSNGTWSKFNFTCQGKCQPPPRLWGAAIIGRDFGIGALVRYVCKPGTFPTDKNSSMAKCLPTKKWSKPNIECVDYTSTHANCLGHTISPVMRPTRKQGFRACIQRCNTIPKCRTLLVDTAPSGEVRCFLKSHECFDKDLKCKGHPRFILYRKVVHVNKSPNRPSVCYKLKHNNCGGRDLYSLGKKPQDVCLEECSQRKWCKSVQWIKWNSNIFSCWGKYYSCKSHETGYRGDKRFHQFARPEQCRKYTWLVLRAQAHEEANQPNQDKRMAKGKHEVPCSSRKKYRKPEGKQYSRYNLVEV